jgi:uncharacterized alkaline shock family protein YloU
MQNNQEILKELGKLARTFNSKRVVSEGELKEVLEAIVKILADNKKGLESLTADIKQTIQQVFKRIEALDVETQDRIKNGLSLFDKDYSTYSKKLKEDSQLTKSEIEKAVKEQNDRAFKRLQTIIAAIRMPKDGKPGEKGEPGEPGKNADSETPESIKDKLETLEDDDRLDAKAIKGLERYFGKVYKKGKDMLVGGIRFFENLADVSIITTNKRQDLIAQYDTTNNRWQDGIAFTVSLTAPTNPKENDVWLDIN